MGKLERGLPRRLAVPRVLSAPTLPPGRDRPRKETIATEITEIIRKMKSPLCPLWLMQRSCYEAHRISAEGQARQDRGVQSAPHQGLARNARGAAAPRLAQLLAVHAPRRAAVRLLRDARELPGRPGRHVARGDQSEVAELHGALLRGPGRDARRPDDGGVGGGVPPGLSDER